MTSNLPVYCTFISFNLHQKRFFLPLKYVRYSSHRTKWTALEAFGYASIVSRIVNVFPVSTIASLSPEVLRTFLEILASLTCTFMELTIKKEDVRIFCVSCCCLNCPIVSVEEAGTIIIIRGVFVIGTELKIKIKNNTPG